MTKLEQLQTLHDRLRVLFQGPLAGVRFPDVDADILAAQLAAARTSEARVEQLRGELDDARRQLAEEETRLEARLERALAYLRVYAEGDATLGAELDTLGAPSRPRAEPTSATARRRGRPPRVSGVLPLGPTNGIATSPEASEPAMTV